MNTQEEIERVIRQVYYNNETGYGSIKKTYDESKKILKSITLEQVKEFMSNQAIRQTKKYRTFNSYVADGPLEEFQIDLAVYVNNADYNDGYKYAFCCIYTFTKFAYVVPLKTNQKVEVAEAFKEILIIWAYAKF